MLNVNLPGMVRAFDRRARMRQGEFANFVSAPDIDEPRSGLAAIATALLPITPNAHTWLAEDHWRLQGVAQARVRPGGQAWDLAYLANITAASNGQAEHDATVSADDTLMALLQTAVNTSLTYGAQRFFARIEDERPELELFGKLGFQRYARESTWAIENAAQGLRALDGAGMSGGLRNGTHEAGEPGASLEDERLTHADDEGDQRGHGRGGLRTRLSTPLLRPQTAAAIHAEAQLRRWSRRDAWSLLRLYDACTPRRVQVAEGLSVEELTHTRAGGGRTWYVPMLEPATAAFVHDEGPLMGGWLRLRLGRGSQPHQLTLLVHPDSPSVARALLKFAMRVFAAEAARPIVCLARDYESATVETLRCAGFERMGSHALLVRHLMARVAWNTDVPAARMMYGVEGLGTAQSRLSEGGRDTLCQKSSMTISIPSSRRFHRAFRRR
ncbi:MAG TPA: hypothetical protein VFN78_05000 [Ktedonobacterales bacterium]|nr:hypothetical protein [Ktedonobacterales bacterium]